MIDEGFNPINHSQWHLIDFIKDEEALRATRNVSTNPIYKLNLKVIRIGDCLMDVAIGRFDH